MVVTVPLGKGRRGGEIRWGSVMRGDLRGRLRGGGLVVALVRC